jgi:DNA primase
LNAFKTVKDAVPLEDYARTLTELRPNGLRLVGRCPLPEHDDRTPSFHVYTGNGSWWCFGCSRGSNVIDLCQAVEGGEPWEAMMTLAIRYGVKLPEKPQSWFEWADEKGRRRKMARDALAAAYQRRYFRVYSSYLPDIEDDEERKAVARVLWDELWPVARHAAIWRMAE